jgi:flagellar biosynthesis protein FliR
MNWIPTISTQQFIVFSLVLTRVSGVVATAPIYGTAETPARIRAFLALTLALLVMPSQWHAAISPPRTLIDYLLIVAAEVSIGLTLGLGVMILFCGVQLAGQVVSQIGGASLAEVFDPTSDSNLPLFSELLRLFTLAIFVLIGGHRLVLGGLLDTFTAIPPGGAGFSATLPEVLSALVGQSFALGVRAAAPVMTALLLASLVLGLIGRTAPQLNIISLGFGLNAMVTLAVLAFSLGAIAWIFQEQVEPLLESVLDAIAWPARTEA